MAGLKVEFVALHVASLATLSWVVFTAQRGLLTCQTKEFSEPCAKIYE